MPFILAASALAAIPVIIHLLHRQQVTPISWGAMQFLTETPLKVKRRRRVDNWLLMLVRMLILLLVVLILSRPLVKNSTLVSKSPMDVAVVIDHSLTMTRRVAGAAAGPANSGTLFDRAIDQTLAISRMLPASATISVVLAEHSPNVRTVSPVRIGPAEFDANSEPTGEWGHTVQLLRQMDPGMTEADIPAAVTAARELLSHGYNTRKLVIILSDEQRSNWRPDDTPAWNAAVGSAVAAQLAGSGYGTLPMYDFPVPGADATGPNVSIRNILIKPTFVGLHRPAQIYASISNTGAADLSNIPIQLLVDGRLIATQNIASLAAGQSQTAHFDQYFPDPGAHWLQVHADAIDSLEADNTATAAVNVHPKLPVLIVDGQLTAGGPNSFPESAFLAAAMQPIEAALDPSALIEPRIISVSQLETGRGTGAAASGIVRLEDYPIVVLNDVPRLPRETLDRLADHASKGNGIWIILGPRSEPDFIKSTLAASPLAPLALESASPARVPVRTPGTVGPAPLLVTVDIKEPSNAAVELLTDSGRNALTGVTLRAWWAVTSTAPQLRTIIATAVGGDEAPAIEPATAPAQTLKSGDPLILEQDVGKAGGRVVIWTTPVGDLEWNNLPLVPSFVPLVNETLFHLASGQETGQPRQLDAGQQLIWTGPASHPIDSAILEAPDHSRRTIQPQLRGDTYLISDKETHLPGLYTLQFVAPPRSGAVTLPPAYFSVNIHPDEFNPSTLNPADLDSFRRHGFLQGALSDKTLAVAMDAQQGGYEFWKWLAILLMLMLVVEVIITRMLARQQSGGTVTQNSALGAFPAGAASAANPAAGGAP